MSTRLGSPDFARSFLHTVAGVARSLPPTSPPNTKAGTAADRPPRIGVIDPAYATGNPRVRFEGETAVSGKEYAFVGTYAPAANDRVIMLPVGTTYVILGPVTPSAGGVFLGRREWDLQVERLFRGLSSSAWETTFHAILDDPNFNDGDVIFLRPGTYPITASIVLDREVRIRSEGMAVIDAAGSFAIINPIGSDDIDIEGVTFDGPGIATYSGTSFGIHGGGASNAARRSRLRVHRCTFRNISAQCIEVEFADVVEVTHCTFESYVRSGGMFLSSEHVKFNNNWVYPPSNGTGNPGGNCYPVAFSRNTNVSLAAQPRTRFFECNDNHFFGDPYWEVIDTHGGMYGKIMRNFVWGGGTDSPGSNAIAIVSSADSGGVSTYAPHFIDVCNNHIDSGVTTGVCPSGIAIDGAGNGTPGGFVELADGIKVLGNTIIGHGRENTSTSGGIVITYARNPTVGGNHLIECSPNGIAVAQDVYDAAFPDNQFRDWWSSNAGFANGAYNFYAANGNSIVTGTITTRGAKSATLINRTAVRIGNTTPPHNVTMPPGSNQLLGTTLTEINNVSTAPVRKGVQRVRGVASSALTLTTSYQDIVGATVTVTTLYGNTVAEIFGSVHFAITTAVAAANCSFRVMVDGVAATGEFFVQASVTGSTTITCRMPATLATAAAHTIKLQAKMSDAGVAGTANIAFSGTYVDVKIEDTP